MWTVLQLILGDSWHRRTVNEMLYLLWQMPVAEMAWSQRWLQASGLGEFKPTGIPIA